MIKIDEDAAVHCIMALEYHATVEALESKWPNVFSKESTVAWDIAQNLRRRVGFIGMSEPAKGCILLKEHL